MNISRVVTPAFLRFARTCWVKQETSPSVLRRTLRGVISPILSDEFSDIRLRMEASSLAVAIVARLDDFPPERNIDLAAIMKYGPEQGRHSVFYGAVEPLLENLHYIFGLKVANLLEKYNLAEQNSDKEIMERCLLQTIELELDRQRHLVPRVFQQLMLEAFNLFILQEEQWPGRGYIMSQHMLETMGAYRSFDAELFDQAVLAHYFKIMNFKGEMVYSSLIRFEPFRRTFAARLRELDSAVAWKAEYARAWFDFFKFGPVEIESFNSGRF